jgi:type II secretory pathway component PulF
MSLFHSTLSFREMSFLTTSLGRTYSAGIPLVRCFSLLAEGSGSRVIRRISRTIGQDIQGEATLAQALNRHERRLPRFFLGMTSVAEETGALGPILDQLARYYEKLLELHRSFERQVTYPIVLLFGIMIGVPIVASVLRSVATGGEIAPYSIAKLIIRPLASAAAVILIAAIIYRIPGVRRGLRTFLFYIPPFSGVMRRFALARFGWSMEMACACGYPLPRGIELARRSTDLLPMELDLAGLITRLEQRETLAEAVASTRYFRPFDKTYLASGEQSGRIPEGFHAMAEANYKQGIFALQLIILPIEAFLIIWIGFGSVPF